MAVVVVVVEMVVEVEVVVVVREVDVAVVVVVVDEHLEHEVLQCGGWLALVVVCSARPDHSS
jgi:hypothetical protein